MPANRQMLASGGSVRSVAMGWARRHRSTASLALVIPVAAAVLLIGAHRAERPAARTGPAQAWLESTVPGIVSLVNGPAARTGAHVALPGSAGHRLRLTRTGQDVYVTDDDTNTVRRIDPATLTAGPAVRLPGPVSVVAAGSDRYLVAPLSGTVTEVDPATLSPRGAPVTVMSPLGTALGTAGGTVWTLSGDGLVLVAVREGRARTYPLPAFRRERLGLVAVANRPVLVNQTKGTVSGLTGDGEPVTWRPLPYRGGDLRLLLPESTPGPAVPMVDPSNRRLLLVGRTTSAVVELASASTGLGTPVQHGDTVYIPDAGTGLLLRYDTRAGRQLAPIRVAPGPQPLVAFVHGDLVWANAPAGPYAAVVERDGRTRAVVKYAPPAPSAAPAASGTPPTRPGGGRDAGGRDAGDLGAGDRGTDARGRPARSPDPRAGGRRGPPKPSATGAGPGGGRRPDPTATGPVLTVPVTYRVTEIRSYQLLEGKPQFSAGNRAKLAGSTWRLSKGGGASYRAPGITSALLPATGGFRANGRRVTYTVRSAYEIPDTSSNTLSVSGTITLGPAPVMRLTYTARSEIWSEVNGETFHTVNVNRFTATVALAAG